MQFSATVLFYIIRFGAPWKSASAPPRGGAREPGRQLLAFHQNRANRLPEQTQRRVYSCTVLALQRGGGVKKIFAGRVSPNEKLQKQPLRLYISLHLTTASTTGVNPSSHTAYDYDYNIRQFSTHTATEWTIYTLGGLWWASHSLFYPNSLDLSCSIVFLYLITIFQYAWQH